MTDASKRPASLFLVAALLSAFLLLAACGDEVAGESTGAPPAPAPVSTTPEAPPEPAAEPTPGADTETPVLPRDPDALDLDGVIEKLSSDDAETRAYGLYRLGLDFDQGALEAGAPRLLPLLDKALDDADAEVRRGAVVAIANIGRWDAARLEAVARRLDDDEVPVRAKAADALGRAGKAAAQVASRLVPALDDAAPVVRHNAAHALAAIGRLLPEAVAPLRRRMRTDEDDEVRVQAALTLGELGARDEAVGKALIEALDDPHGEVRAAAAWALGALRLAAAQAKPLLEALLQDENPEVREAARQALERLR